MLHWSAINSIDKLQKEGGNWVSSKQNFVYTFKCSFRDLFTNVGSHDFINVLEAIRSRVTSDMNKLF